MKTIAPLFALLLLAGCAKEKLPEEPNDCFFYGTFSAVHNGEAGHWSEEYGSTGLREIETYQEKPMYRFRFSRTSPIIPPEYPDRIGTTILEVALDDPQTGRTYRLSTKPSVRETLRQGIVYHRKARSATSGRDLPGQAYVPIAESPIMLTVTKMELSPVHGVQIVEGEVQAGYLRNELDSQDSVAIWARFRTKMYK